jgi:CMP-N-acetylneuraminic acid synthetase
MSIIAFIFARGGSKGLPGKNVRLLEGKPLIAWSIEQALASKGIKRVIVSTDSDEIAAIARKFGAEVPFKRPEDLSQDSSPEWGAWRHALNYLQSESGKLPEVMVSVPATAPLRSTKDIESCLALYQEGEAEVVITVSDSQRSPYFNMVKENNDGSVSLIIPPASSTSRRQDAPPVYDITTVCYVLNPEFVLSHNSIFEGRVKAVHVPRERALDIDTLFDFQMAEYMLKVLAK